MKLRALRVENFLSFQGAHVFPLAGRGLVSVFGPNGAGKSSILDAVLWALIGETGPRRDSADSGLKTDAVVNDVAGGGCVVQLEWESGDDVYRVERWRKAKSESARRLKNSGVRLDIWAGNGSVVDGEWRTVADLDADNVQGFVDRAFGIPRELIPQVLVRSQEDRFNFAQASPSDRFAILTRVEGLEELDEVGQRARARARELVTEVERLRGAIHGRASTREMLREEDAETQSERWEETRAERARAQLEIAAEQDRKAADKRAQVDKRATYRTTVEEIDAKLPGLAASAEPENLAGWRTHVARLGERERQARVSYDDIVRRLERLSARGEGVCDECGQAVTADHVEIHRGVLEGRATDTQRSVLAAQEEIRKSQETVDAATAQLVEHNRGIEATRATLTRERNAAAQAAHALDLLEREIPFHEEQAARARAAAEQATEEPNPHERRAAEVAERLAKLDAEVASLEEAIEAQRHEARLLEWWVRSIPSLKSWIFDSVVDTLTADANRWLSILMDGRCVVRVESTTRTAKGETRDKVGLSCWEWKPDGTSVERPFRQWSGGEKRCIAVALDWALSTRLAQRAGAQCSFLALDEVDRHMDPAAAERLFSALAQLRKEKDSVLVITHDVEMRHAPDEGWSVSKTAAGSRVEIRSGDEKAQTTYSEAERGAVAAR